MRARRATAAVALMFLWVVPSTGARPAAARTLPRYTFASGEGGSILVHGTYPKVPSPCRFPVQPILHARFTGAIEVGMDDQGKLFVIGIVPFEDYLKGIGEVPRLWPMEALKAQVVAARSYALAHINYPDPTGQALGYQLCATQACQVYVGLGIANGPYGNRWRRAVDRTRGQVLTYDGRPTDALYFSTSNGHTLGNDQVFGSAPLPYLRPITERDDRASPLSHWQTAIALADLTRYLRNAGAWSWGEVTSISVHGSNVRLSGGGHSTSLGVSSFRNDLNSWAHCLDPDRYPTVNAVNGTRLPQTVPSIWFTASVRGSAAVLTGRGWGHGVGLVQWGAEGKADRGLSYRQILADYYGGLRPHTYPEPLVIRVGIAVGLRSVWVSGIGPVTVAGATVGPGPWQVLGGRVLRIRRAPPPPTYIRAGTLTAPAHARSRRTIRVTVSVPQLSVVSLVLSREGTEVPFLVPVTLQAGEHRLVAKVPRVVSGTYSIQAVVSDGVDIVRTGPRRIQIAGIAPTPSPSPTLPPSTSPSTRSAQEAKRAAHGWGPALPVALALVGVALAGAVLIVGLQRRNGGQARAGNGGVDHGMDGEPPTG